MAQRLKSLLALWFVLQIPLPFTAPFQTCSLRDLLGTHQRGAPTSSESSPMPLASEADSKAHSFMSPLGVWSLPSSTSLPVASRVGTRAPLMATRDLSLSPHAQQTVLRV
jgi:hypothetical protein